MNKINPAGGKSTNFQTLKPINFYEMRGTDVNLPE